MFPVREGSSRYLATALAALLISIQLVYISMWTLNLQSNKEALKIDKMVVNMDYQDNWSKEPLKVDAKANSQGEKLIVLAEKYNAEPEYLQYIVQIEKMFDLEPCELLALIAQESGFKPQTHMDGGTLSYNTTQMKLPTAKTAYMAITEYYKMEIPYPTDELLRSDKNYAAFLAGGYLRYLHDTYKDKYESYTAYNWGIGGRMVFYKNNGHFKSSYALKVANLESSFINYVGEEYHQLKSFSDGNQTSAFFTYKQIT